MKILIFVLFITGQFLFNKSSAQDKSLDIDLTGLNYPYAVNLMSFDSQNQNLKMAYMYEKSSVPNGKTIVLLHGKNFNGYYWGSTMEYLLKDGYDVIVPDQIGFGKSTKPSNYNYTFQQLSENTKLLLDTLGINKIILLGHSMGGMLAARFTLMYPERIEKLILENPIGFEDWKLKVPYTSIDENYKTELKKTRESVKKYFLENYFHNDWKSDYDVLVYLNTAYLNDAEYPRLAWNAALTSDMIFTQPVYYEFDNISVPTVLIIGQKDRTAIGKEKVSAEIAKTMGNYKELGEKIEAKITNSRLLKIYDCGHIPHTENFEEFKNSLSIALK